MKKNWVLVIMIVLVILSYFFYKKENTMDDINGGLSIQRDQEKAASLTPETVEEKQPSLIEIMGAAGKSQVCTFRNKTTSGNISEGVIYSGEWKLRGDFSVIYNGKKTESHMIVTDNDSYIWEDGKTEGVKSKFGEENLSVLDSSTPESSDNPDNLDENDSKYECKDWKVDESFFNLPKNVSFKTN